MNYILKNGKPVLETDVIAWAKWWETADRIINRTTISRNDENIIISTVFLGIDHNWLGETDEHILWETMIFGGDLDGEQWRYSSLEDALAGHSTVVGRVHKSLKGK